MEKFNFGWIALGLSIILNIFPITYLYNFYEKKINFDNISASKIFSNYSNSLIWFFYGSLLFINEIKIANLISAIISFMFIIIYLVFEFKIYFLDCIFNSIIVIIGTMAVYRWFGFIILDKDIVGRICITTTIISILSQIPDIYTNFKEKNYFYSIHINYSIISFPTYFCWIIFGIKIGDYYILIANLIKIISNFLSIILYIYNNKEIPIINDDESVASMNINEESKKEISKEGTIEIIHLK